MAKGKTIFVADHFCGAGGTSTGVAQACAELGIGVDLLAINHWQIAIDTHTAAHPWARHMCQELQMVKPREAVPGGRLHLLVASPECTNHSIAKGGRPKDEQSRATGWDVLKWLQELYVDNVILENVKEWRKWGPLGADLKPLKSREGETFNAFIAVMVSMGYRVEHRVLNCADFGAPTSRERLFVIARRGNKQIHWPQPTHSRTGNSTLFGKMKPYRTAREIIDWTIPNPSIFSRTRPLKPNTMRRILAGLAKVNPQLEPFLVHLRGNCDARPLDNSVPTLTAGGGHLALCEPVVLGQQSGAVARSVSEPIPTVATAGAIALAEAVIVTVNHGEGDETRRSQSVDETLPTLTTKNGLGIAEPIIIPMFGERDGQSPRNHSVDEPMPTVTCQPRHGLVESIIVPIDNTGSNALGTRSVDAPLSTITTEARHALADAVLVKYYGTATAKSVDQPLDAVTCKDRFGLVQLVIDGQTYALDIRFRMLQPHELAAATTFPPAYPFAGNKSQQTKQIGNAVPPIMGRVLATPILREYVAKPKTLAEVVPINATTEKERVA